MQSFSINPKLLLFLALPLAGTLYYGVDYLNGGIERVTTEEAQSCVAQIGTIAETEWDANLTNRGGGDVVYAKVREGSADRTVAVMVLDGGDDAPTKGWDDGGNPPEYHTLIGNSAVVWYGDPQPPGLGQLGDCLQEEKKDA
jgi:hypothetical protein